MLEGEDLGRGEVGEDGEGDGAITILTVKHVGLDVVNDRDDEGTERIEDKVGDFEVGSEAIGPAEKEVKEEGRRGLGKGSHDITPTNSLAGSCHLLD